MAVISYAIVCKRKKLVAPGVFELQFTKPGNFIFNAGQFVLFDVPLISNPADIQPRAYSIASAPGETDFLFVVKLIPGGRASMWIEQVLKEGSEVNIKGPFGFFTIKSEDTRDVLLIATGAGIAPFRSQAKWLLEEQKDTRQISVIFGVRNQQDFFWRGEFELLAANHPNFHFHPTLSGDEQEWIGHRGRVQLVAEKIIPDFSAMSVFVCGAPAMVNDVKKLALESWKVPKQQLHCEGYI